MHPAAFKNQLKHTFISQTTIESFYKPMPVLARLLQHKIIAIIRGVQPDGVLPIAEALFEGGVKALEITLNSPNAYEVIKQVSYKWGAHMLVGAGTVLDASAALKAIDAGAQFIISPSYDRATIEATKKENKVSIPGAFTPTEIVTAHAVGADLIKVFPALSPAYIRDLRGPLSHIPLMPTGGVNLENITAFQKAGAVAFGIGNSLVDASQAVTDDYLKQLIQKAQLFQKAIAHE